MSGYHPSHRPGSRPTFAALGAASTGFSRTIAAAVEYAAAIEWERSKHGDAHAGRVVWCYEAMPFPVEGAVFHAARLAVFEWMAGVSVADHRARFATDREAGRDIADMTRSGSNRPPGGES